MNKEEYDLLVDGCYGELQKDVIELNKKATEHLNIGCMVKDKKNRLFLIKAISYDSYWQTYGPPEVTIDAVRYSPNRVNISTWRLSFWEIQIADDIDIENARKIMNAKICRNLKNKRDTEPLYKMTVNLRSRTCIAFKSNGWKKGSPTKELLGIDFPIAKKHIERQFKKGMSWDNYGDWHIDHVIPLAIAKCEKELMDLCHYSNLQPLWKTENLQKGKKIVPTQTKLTV